MNMINEAGAGVRVQPAAGAGASENSLELRTLFHRLNNQLSIILAHAELMESRALTETERARATQVVTSVLDAMSTARQIRQQGKNG